jgi:hypothetical protein
MRGRRRRRCGLRKACGGCQPGPRPTAWCHTRATRRVPRAASRTGARKSSQARPSRRPSCTSRRGTASAARGGKLARRRLGPEVSALGAAAAAAYRPAKSSALSANTAPNRPHTSQRWHNDLMAGRARDMGAECSTCDGGRQPGPALGVGSGQASELERASRPQLGATRTSRGGPAARSPTATGFGHRTPRAPLRACS